MSKLNKVIQQLIIALNGAFIGAMVLIALVLVPFWKASAPQDFLNWFAAYGNDIGNVMIPLGPGVLILSIIAFMLNKNNRLLWAATALLTLANILYFPVYFLPTNTSFHEQAILLTEIKGELNNWLNYHWQRTFFAMGALTASIMAVVKE